MLRKDGIEDLQARSAQFDQAKEEALAVRRHELEQEARLREERAKKKVLWEEELQRELEYQRQQKRDASRRSIGGASSSQVYPE